jgi:hypothetical protein
MAIERILCQTTNLEPMRLKSSSSAELLVDPHTRLSRNMGVAVDY